MSYDLGTAHGKIVLDYDGKGSADQASKDIEKVSKDSKDGDKSVKGLKKSLELLGEAGKKLALGVLFSQAAVGAANFGIQILGIIPQLASILSLSAAIPTAIVGIAASVGVLKTAFSGVGDALKLAFDPKKAKEFQAALDKLSPSARAFAKSVQAVGPAAHEMKLGIQEAFFSTAQLAKAMPDLVGVLKTLQPQLEGLSGDFGGVAKNLVDFGKNSETIAFVSEAIDAFKYALDLVTPSIVPILTGLRNVGVIGLSLIPRLGAAVSGVATQFADWLDKITASGQLQAWIATAISTLSTLGGLLKNIGSIFVSVVTVAQSTGGGLLNTLEGLTGQLAAFLKSTDGIATLTSIFSAIASVAAPLAPIFVLVASTLAKALGPAIIAITSALGPALLAALQALAPAVGPLAAALASLVVAVTPLLPAIAPLVVTLASLATTVITALTPALAGISGFLAQNTGLVKGLAAAVAVLGAVMLTSSAITAVQAAGGLLKYLASLKIVTAATKVWTAVQTVLNFVLDANPIGLIVIAIAALAAGIYLAWTHSETFRKVLIAIWGAIVSTAKAIGGAFVSAFKTVVGIFTQLPELLSKVGHFFASLPGLALSALANLASALGSLVSTIGGAILGFFTSLPGKILAGLQALPGLLIAFIKTTLTGFVQAVAFSIGLIVGIFIKLPLDILRAIETIGPIIGGALKSAWDSAYNATVTAIGAVVSFAASLPGKIKDAIVALGGFIKDVAVSAWNNFRAAVVNGIIATVNYARTLPGKIRSGINSLGSLIRNVAVSAWNGFRSAVVSGVNNSVNFVKGLPGKIKSALGNIGSILINSGKAIIDGLLNGIKSGADKVLNFLKGLGQKAKDAFNNALNIFSPSRDFHESGEYIDQGLINGIKSKIKDVQRVAQTLAQSVIAPTLQLPTAATMAINGIPALPAARALAASTDAGQGDFGPYELKVDQGTLTAFTIDAVTGNPKPVAKAADEGKRQNQFAGSGRKGQ